MKATARKRDFISFFAAKEPTKSRLIFCGYLRCCGGLELTFAPTPPIFWSYSPRSAVETDERRREQKEIFLEEDAATFSRPRDLSFVILA